MNTTSTHCCFALLVFFLYVRETHGSSASYHKELAKELGTFLEKIIKVRIQ